jgi:hypothetical protein
VAENSDGAGGSGAHAALIAAYGAEAVGAASHLMKRAIDAEREITKSLLGSLPDQTRAHGLSNRVKSVGSLARKLRKYADQRFVSPQEVAASMNDVVRFTVVASTPEDLVDKTLEAVARLEDRGWRVETAHHSYLPGNRYKGIHAMMREPGGLAVEVQFHSEHSLAVKEATTRLYGVERDQTLGTSGRAAARQVMIELSDELTTPPGLDQLERLGEAFVTVKRYPGSKAGGRNVVRSGQDLGKPAHRDDAVRHKRKGSTGEAIQSR